MKLDLSPLVLKEAFSLQPENSGGEKNCPRFKMENPREEKNIHFSLLETLLTS